ncbi:MAG TPA: hypothetical protein ENK97_01225 [Campylobacteraceae bacterium]|nr:hypothetical protein [Campylobacteraceae bacterium]
MQTNTLVKLGKSLALGALLSFAAISLQACNDQAKEVKTDRALKSNCQMKCKTGKCGDAKKAPAMKCQTGKCGDAKAAPAPVMKCQGGKCGQGK